MTGKQYLEFVETDMALSDARRAKFWRPLRKALAWAIIVLFLTPVLYYCGPFVLLMAAMIGIFGIFAWAVVEVIGD